MIIRGAIVVCMLAALAAAGAPARGAVATCSDSRHYTSGRAPTASHDRDSDDESHNEFQRLFCFDHDETSGAAHERGCLAPFIGHLFHDGKAVCVAIDCEKLGVNQRSRSSEFAEDFCKQGDRYIDQSEKSHDSHGSHLLIVKDNQQGSPSKKDGSPYGPGNPTSNADNSPAVSGHNSSQNAASPQTDNDRSDKTNNSSDGAPHDYGESTKDFSTASNISDFSPNEFPSTAGDDAPPASSTWSGTNESIPQTSSASVSSFSPILAFDFVESGATSNPEPASLLIWGGLGAIIVGVHSCRRRQSA